WPFKNAPLIPLVNFHELPYTPWSDNHYWVAFGVPAPLIMSWPDLYFHTQLLTAEHTDPMVFERSGRTLGTLALAIADAGARQARPILEEVAAKASLRIGRAVRDATRNPINASVGPRDGGRQPPSLETDGRDRPRLCNGAGVAGPTRKLRRWSRPCALRIPASRGRHCASSQTSCGTLLTVAGRSGRSPKPSPSSSASPLVKSISSRWRAAWSAR